MVLPIRKSPTASASALNPCAGISSIFIKSSTSILALKRPLNSVHALNWTQIQVSRRTRAIHLGSFTGAPVVVHRDLPGELLQAHPAGVSAVLLKGAAECARHIADPGKVAEVLYLVVAKVDRRRHAR